MTCEHVCLIYSHKSWPDPALCSVGSFVWSSLLFVNGLYIFQHTFDLCLCSLTFVMGIYSQWLSLLPQCSVHVVQRCTATPLQNRHGVFATEGRELSQIASCFCHGTFARNDCVSSLLWLAGKKHRMMEVIGEALYHRSYSMLCYNDASFPLTEPEQSASARLDFIPRWH